VKEAVTDIMTALSDSSERVRSSAIDALAEMGAKEAIPQILSLFRNKEEKPSVRFRRAIVLGDLNATEAVDDLIAALKDEVEDVRWGAAMAFKKIKSPKAVPALIDAITDKSQKVSAEAIRALYFQTGEKVTPDWFRKESEWKTAQEKWRIWWNENKDRFK
jgi:HEAT repeat protein